MSTDNESLRTETLGSSTSRIFSLPHELLQSILDSITNFEPWTYTSTPEGADMFINDDDLLLYTREAKPINLTSIHRHILGLSSENKWLMVILARHPYHLSRSDRIGISSAITQALRRMNARLEQIHWAQRDTEGAPDARQSRTTLKEKRSNLAGSEGTSASVSATSQTAINAPRKQCHASVCTEEESLCSESVITRRPRTARSHESHSSNASAVVVYQPIPILKVTSQDVAHLANHPQPTEPTERIAAILVAVLIYLVQCRISLLENLEKLERDTPIPSIEPCEGKDFATPRTSPRHDRMRSMSGSTVAEAMPHTEPLSLSTISTVYSLGSEHKEIKWAEKRVSEERDVGTSPKRPKLTEYKQVSSGRVATLMDRFEKFHL